MRSRASALVLWTLTLFLLAATPVLASDNGEGLAGETDDKIVTFFSLGVVVFFALFVVLMSVLQRKLERRKEEKKAAALHHRIGW